MKKFKIRKGDNVRVIAGAQKGNEGKVIKIVSGSNRVIVEGINLVKKHTKPNAQSPQGGIVEKEASIDISNISIVTSDGKTSRIGYRIEDDKKNRYSKKSNEII
ncbi:MAG: 50S ribosomal protein L24 [Flavobacteriaceae bacterium]|nr:50S ribosomal protein L24 [Flavobacteriaceae bacterium]|tara:strand:- start:8994 stop:9305 length:312 start_codon:yes stop_codon:yes gene_type:complete